jgi:hypothetical protein
MRVYVAKGAVAFFTFCGVSAALPASSRAADFKFVPLLSVSEEFNDNLFESRGSGRKEFITRVQPSVAVSSEGAGLVWDSSFGLDYRNYARSSKSDELNPRAALNGKFTFLDGFLKLDTGDSYSRVSLDVARDRVADSPVANQTEQNIGFISPYLTWRLADKVSLKTGYRYNDVRYWQSSGIDKRQHDAFAELSDEVSSNLTLNTGYNFSHALADPTGFDRHDVYGGFKFDYGQGTTLFGKVGNSWQSFSNGVSLSHIFWDAGATKDFGFLTAALGTRVQYTEDPLTLSTRETGYNATLTKVLPRGLISLTGAYTQYDKNLSGDTQRQRKTSVGASGRYEMAQDLTLFLSATGDRLTKTSPSDYLYHLNGSATLDYLLNKHTSVGVTYIHVSYRDNLDSSTGSTEVNRAIAEVRLSL